MTSNTITVISPHIDDAVLSLGGLIDKLAPEFDIRVINIFTLSNWINPNGIFKSKYAETDTDIISGMRKAEEMESNRQLHYRSEFLDFPDRPLRDNTMPQHELHGRIKDVIKEYLEKDSCVLFPLGVDHPDHKIIAAIGNELFEEGHCILFYEDMPYTARKYGSGDLVKAMAVQRGLSPLSFEIDIQRKLESIKVYESQISEYWLTDIYNYSQKEGSSMFFEYIWCSKGFRLCLSR